MSACPKSIWTTLKSAPLLIIWVANACLKTCGESFWTSKPTFFEYMAEEIKLFLQFSKASDLGFETKDSTPPLNMFKGDEHLFD